MDSVYHEIPIDRCLTQLLMIWNYAIFKCKFPQVFFNWLFFFYENFTLRNARYCRSVVRYTLAIFSEVLNFFHEWRSKFKITKEMKNWSIVICCHRMSNLSCNREGQWNFGEIFQALAKIRVNDANHPIASCITYASLVSGSIPIMATTAVITHQRWGNASRVIQQCFLEDFPQYVRQYRRSRVRTSLAKLANLLIQGFLGWKSTPNALY